MTFQSGGLANLRRGREINLLGHGVLLMSTLKDGNFAKRYLVNEKRGEKKEKENIISSICVCSRWAAPPHCKVNSLSSETAICCLSVIPAVETYLL